MSDSIPDPCRVVALVGPTYPIRGGISHYTTLLAQALAQRHAVHLFAFSRQYPQWLFPGRSEREPAGSALPTVPHRAMLDGVNPLTWWRTAQAIRVLRPDWLILQWTVPFWAPLLGLLLGYAPRGTCKLLICHNAIPHETGSMAWIREHVQRAVLGRADALLCHSESDRELLSAMLPRVPVERVMHPTYAPLATPPAVEDEAVGDPQLLFFGFVRPYKGLETLFRAMPRVLRHFPSARLTVAGEWWPDSEPLRDRIPAEAAHAIEIRDRYIPQDEMGALFHAADVVVLPYRSATQSGVVQLAFGFGVPVITTAVGGLPEAVTDGVNGLLVPPDNPEALAEAIIRYHRAGWRVRLVPGVVEARSRFSWQALVERLEALCPP